MVVTQSIYKHRGALQLVIKGYSSSILEGHQPMVSLRRGGVEDLGVRGRQELWLLGAAQQPRVVLVLISMVLWPISWLVVDPRASGRVC